MTSYLEVIPGQKADCRKLASSYSTCLCSRVTGHVVFLGVQSVLPFGVVRPPTCSVDSRDPSRNAERQHR
jgi:hypothetical protein